jgi:MFS family permease
MKSRLAETLRSLATRVLGAERLRAVSRTLSPVTDRVADRRDRFREWRRHRPVAGGVVMILGAVVIGYMPTVIALQRVTLSGGRASFGMLCAVLVGVSGIGAVTRPVRSTLFGVAGSVCSLLSLVGTLGGFLVGTMLGVVGGSLCVAWTDEEQRDRTEDGLSTDEVAQ